MVDLATQHPELRAAVIQVPMLDGLVTVRAVPLPRLLKFIAYALVDLFKPGTGIHVPTLAETGDFGTMDRDHAWDALQRGIKAL
ncbi:hypothetical protein ABTM61_19075, partial [Acinetobacter baumannii]